MIKLLTAVALLAALASGYASAQQTTTVRDAFGREALTTTRDRDGRVTVRDRMGRDRGTIDPAPRADERERRRMDWRGGEFQNIGGLVYGN
jgi:hypothetical protein